MKILTHSRLLELISYDPETGEFRWKVHKHSVKPGSIAGGLNIAQGYWQIRIDGELYRGHVLAWFYQTGEWPLHEVDHKDNIRSNNRWLNLRSANDRQQARNVRKHRDNTVGYKGVSFDNRRNCYNARIWSKGRNHWLGSFDNPKDAHAVYARASKECHGEYGRID